MGAVPRFGGGLSRFKGESVDGEQEPSEGKVSRRERAGVSPLLPDSRARSREVAPERAEALHIEYGVPTIPGVAACRGWNGHNASLRTPL